MPEVIISASGPQYGLVINADGTIGVSGTFTNAEVLPTEGNNPEFSFVYIVSGTATGVTGSAIGSIIQFIDTGSYIQTLTYSDDLIINVGSWI